MIILCYGEKFDWIYNCIDRPKNSLYLWTKDTNNVQKLLKSKSEALITRKTKPDLTKKIVHASYSSTGPARYGILKPDLVAPGTKVISGRLCTKSINSKDCSDYIKKPYFLYNGTSMSTPNVAGTTALMQQYFQSGKWNSIQLGSFIKDGEKIVLDSSTTKALLINSCIHPLGSKTPDIMYGHGVVDISTVIPLKKNFGVKLTYQVNYPYFGDSISNYKKVSVKENGHVSTTITIKKSNKQDKLQITLSYNDAVLDYLSPIPLVRDIDLVVESPSKKIYLGDHLKNGDTQHTSTNEKVIINGDELENGVYKIHVYGGFFADTNALKNEKKQIFSVVATGHFSDGYMTFSESSECPCQKCDPNNPGYCLCNESQNIGPVCQGKIETIIGKKGRFIVGSLEILRIKFISDKEINYIYSKSANPGPYSTIWSSKKCHLSLGEYEKNGKIGNNKYEEIIVNYKSKEACIAIFNANDISSTYEIEVSNEKKNLNEQTPTKSPITPNLPEPTKAPKKTKKSGGCSPKDDKKQKSSSINLGNIEIRTAYLGISSTVFYNFNFLASLFRKVRKIFGHAIPPPDFVHSAIWVGEFDATDESIGAIFVYGKYYPSYNDQTYIYKNGAQTYIMTLGEFKKKYNSVDIFKLNPKRKINLFDFINEIKANGQWTADEYNWPTKNCQHFTAECIKILQAVRFHPRNNDWFYLPKSIINILQSNEMKKL